MTDHNPKPDLRSLLAAGTARPWRIQSRESSYGITIDGIIGPPQIEEHGLGPEDMAPRIVETDGGHYGPEEPDAHLIAAAVNVLEDHLDRIAELEKALADACDLAEACGIPAVPPTLTRDRWAVARIRETLAALRSKGTR